MSSTSSLTPQEAIRDTRTVKTVRIIVHTAGAAGPTISDNHWSIFLLLHVGKPSGSTWQQKLATSMANCYGASTIISSRPLQSDTGISTFKGRFEYATLPIFSTANIVICMTCPEEALGVGGGCT
jgi:hypothetical protein